MGKLIAGILSIVFGLAVASSTNADQLGSNQGKRVCVVQVRDVATQEPIKGAKVSIMKKEQGEGIVDAGKAMTDENGIAEIYYKYWVGFSDREPASPTVKLAIFKIGYIQTYGADCMFFDPKIYYNYRQSQPCLAYLKKYQIIKSHNILN